MNGLLFNIDSKNNYSKIRNNDEFFFYDKDRYLEYKNEHLKFPETPEKYLWDIFLDNVINQD